MRTKLIAGNWKMNGSLAANDALLRAVLAGLQGAACEVAVCVPAPYLAQVRALQSGTPLQLGAQAGAEALFGLGPLVLGCVGHRRLRFPVRRSSRG